MNPLSIDSGSKEQIDKSLGELYKTVGRQPLHIAKQLLTVQSPAGSSPTRNYVGT